MQKILPIFLALSATLIALGVVFVVTRFGSSLPSRIRTLEWRPTGENAPDEPAEEAPAV